MRPATNVGARSARLARGALLVVLPALLAACSTLPRRPAPDYWYASAVPAGFPDSVRAAARPETLDERAPEVVRRVVEAAHGGPVNVLALSGGGAGAAFGAGALVGWGRRGTRPDFQIVTGVSAGALIAPFAFLGAEGDESLREAFSGGPTAHLLQRRWAFAWLNSSFYRGEPLVEFVDRYVTDELLAAVARKAASGAVLLVATTNLDTQRSVIWNLGVVAAIGGERGRRLFRDIIVASASIPGVFPPVVIAVEESGAQFDELHVDGGTTAPLFIAPEIVNVLPERLVPLRGANVYVIVNGQLGVPAETTASTTIPVVKRSISAALQSSSRLAIEVASAVSRQNGMAFRLTAIPSGFPYHGPLEASPATMRSLFEFGADCAADDALWGSSLEVLQAADADPKRFADAAARCPVSPLSVVATAGEAAAGRP